MSKKKRKKKDFTYFYYQKMNNDKRLLIEFVNEDNSIVVGFQDWLIKDKDEENITTILKKKTLVRISWPSYEIKRNRTQQEKDDQIIDQKRTHQQSEFLHFGGILPYTYESQKYLYGRRADIDAMFFFMSIFILNIYNILGVHNNFVSAVFFPKFEALL